MTVSAFYDLSIDPDTLRFSFVRNPYARLVSSWADKFANKPLVAGDLLVDLYLRERPAVDVKLPCGPDHSLSFEDFVRFVAALPEANRDSHFQAQSTILDIPGLTYSFIGRVESFNSDFARVLDFVNAPDSIRKEAATPINESDHNDWAAYYTPELAKSVYRTFEADFDRFRYSAAVPEGGRRR